MSYIKKRGRLIKVPESVYIQPVVKEKPPVKKETVEKPKKKKKGDNSK